MSRSNVIPFEYNTYDQLPITTESTESTENAESKNSQTYQSSSWRVGNTYTIKGVVEKMFFSSPTWSAGLLAPENPVERALRFRIKGFLNPGDNVIITGIWVKDNSYGTQLDVTKLEYNQEFSKEGLIKYLAHNPIIKNIGIKRARTIVEFFSPNGFEDALNQSPEYVAKIAKVNLEDIKNLQLQWNNTKHLNKALAQLADWDLTNHQIKTLIDKLGTFTISLLKANPYLLIDNLDGFGFSKVDKIAQKIGVSKYLPTRIQAGIQYTLGQQLQSGSTWITENSLLDEANRILNLDSLESLQLIQNELNDLVRQNKVYRFRHTNLTDEFLIAIPNVHHIESTIASKLINCQKAKLNKETIAHTLETTFSKRANRLHPKQKEAVIKVFTSNLSLISGGGGTGKTHCIGLIADLAEHYNMTVAICAPTGKAAKRITEATDWDAITIHRLLEYDGFNWGRNASRLLSYDLIIIDESSMIDSLLLYRLFDAILLSDTSVVFVGDHNQLPPVGWGNPLRDLITTQIIPTTILDKVVRQDLILKDNTLDILKGKVAPTANTPGVRPWYLVDKFKEEGQIIDFLVDLYANTLEEKLNFNILYDVQVLTSRHDTPLGTVNLNLVLQRLIQKKLYKKIINNSLPAKGQPPLFIGDKVIQIKNNYKCGQEQLEVMNGSIGIVGDIYTAYDENDKPTEYIQITFDCGIVTIKSKSSEREDIRLAYALTAHKCVTPNTLLNLDNGLYYIGDLAKDLSVGEEKEKRFLVAGETKFNYTNRIYSEGVKPTIKATTRAGFEIEGTHDHPLLVCEPSGQHVWKFLSDIKTGDTLVIRKNIGSGSKYLFSTEKFKSNLLDTTSMHRRIGVVPKYINEDIAWLLGVLIGDGNFTDKKDGRVELAAMSSEIMDQAIKIAREQFSVNPTRKTKSMYFHSRLIREFLHWLGLDYVKAKLKKVPWPIFISPLSVQKKFLQGLFDTDGGVGKTSVNFASTSETLTFEVQQLLLNNGIISKRYLLRGTVEGKNWSPAWRVDIYGDDARNFKSNIGFVVKRKNEQLEKFFGKSSKEIKSNWGTIPDGQNLAEELIKELRNRSSRNYPEAKTIGTLLRRVKQSAARLSVYHCLSISKQVHNLETLGNAGQRIKTIVQNSIFYDPVVTVTASESPVFDVQVPEDHTFLGNGIVNHNCQGSEFPCVIIVCHKSHSFQHHRNWLYTAVSRAKETCIILGDRWGINNCATTTSTDRRNTFLSFMANWYGLENLNENKKGRLF